MPSNEDEDLSLKLAADIVIAYLGSGTLDPAALPGLVREVRAALRDNPVGVAPRSGGVKGEEPVDAQPAPTEEAPVPAVPVQASVFPDYIVSLEDGRKFRSLRRHLMAKYGMTPDDYRRKWQLPPDYPMVAPDYAQSRSEIAKKSGLGRNQKAPAKGTPKRRAAR